MKVTKRVLVEALEESLQLLESHFGSIGNEVELGWISEMDYLEGIKEAPFYRDLFQLGILNPDGREISSFAVVYPQDKHLLRKLFELPYVITICEPIAQRVLKPIPHNKGFEYLKHIMMHELVHIMEESLIKVNHPLWEEALREAQENGQDEEAARELMALNIPEQLLNKAWIMEVEDTISRPLNQKIEQYKAQFRRAY